METDELPNALWINRSKSGQAIKIGIKCEDGYKNYIAPINVLMDFVNGKRSSVALNDVDSIDFDKNQKPEQQKISK